MAKEGQLVFMQVTITALGPDLHYRFRVISTRTEKERLLLVEATSASPRDQFSFIVGPTQEDVDKTSAPGGVTVIYLEPTSKNSLRNCTFQDRRVAIAARAAMDGCMCLVSFPSEQRTLPRVKHRASTAAAEAFATMRDMAIAEDESVFQCFAK
ncbi:EsV-1-152 [Ectocarpus siliculosus]|uniref:EsV-1-152 n=1 Tax=Ectocarpus siliculosus TaxID=2880 RepID=D8LPH4_ECTSI|nr:EsV-1-152 [Ectocarpus siliculosus]|eukprot:CBN80446.1 EsV-1-152 [Ectocarpus siliculosus]